MSDNISIGSEFSALPLAFVISAPLTGAIEAQAIAAHTSLSFIEGIKDQTTEFSSKLTVDGKEQTAKISVPMLTCVHVPHLRIDSITTHFRFEITQSLRQESKTDANLQGKVGLPKVLSWLDMSLSGGVAHSSSNEETTNRSGVLDVTVHASESDIPEGLQKVLTWLTASIQVQALPIPARP